MSEIDLTPFCSTERPDLRLTFSWGEWTYATNGHICVRVPRRDDVPEVKAAPSAAVEALFGLSHGELVPFPAIPEDVIPDEAIAPQTCSACRGAGTPGHDCPDCKCLCLNCSGAGKVAPVFSCSVRLPGLVHLDARYALLIAGLPRIVMYAPAGNPMYFRFHGGEGVIMPLFRRGKWHIDLAAVVE